MTLRVNDEDEAGIVIRVLMNNGYTVTAQRVFCEGMEETVIEVEKAGYCPWQE